jgi:phage gpG-like protein
VFRITVTETGGREIVAGFKQLAQRVEDLRPVWPRVQELFYEFENQAFESEGASSAVGKWAALSERYSKWKERHYPGRPILQRTDALRSSLIRSGFGSTVMMEPLWMQITSEVEYAQYHQRGTPKMPARKPVALRRDQVAAFGMAIHRYIDKDVMKSLISQIAAEQRARMPVAA